MSKTRKLRDEELIFLVCQENENAYQLLFERYRRYSWKLAHSMHAQNSSSGIDTSVFHSIAIYCFHCALKKYKTHSNNFYPYWKTISNRQMIDFIQEQSYQYRGQVFGGFVSLDANFNDTSSLTFGEMLGEVDKNIDRKINFDDLIKILKRNENLFSTREYQVINLLINEHTIKEISCSLNLPIEKVYYHIKMIKKKIRSLNIRQCVF